MLIAEEKLVLAAQELEPLPMTVTRLGQILSSVNWDLKDVEEAIALDQALAPKILRLANSALASRGHAVSTVRDAVMRIGTGPIFSMAMALGVQRRFKTTVVQYSAGEGQLWVHSVASALTVEILNGMHKRRLPVESFTAALLHDVGQLLMGRFLDAPSVQRLRAAEDRGPAVAREEEIEALGFGHGGIGAIVARRWELPQRLILGIAHHHAPTESSDPIAHVVHVADAVARLVDWRRSGRAPAPIDQLVVEASREELELDADDFAKLAAEVDARLSDVLKRYS